MSPEINETQRSLDEILNGGQDVQILEDINRFGFIVSDDENARTQAIEEFTGYKRTDPEYQVSNQLLRAVKLTSTMPQRLPAEVIASTTIHWARALGGLRLLSTCKSSERALYIGQMVRYFHENTQETPEDLMSHISWIEKAIVMYEQSQQN